MPSYERWRAFGSDDPNAIKTRRIFSAAPAFAFGLSQQTVPGHEYWLPQLIRFTYTSSATVATRSPFLAYQVGGSQLYQMQLGVQQVASLTWTYVFVYGWPQVWNTSDVTNTIVAPLPDIILEPGYNINITVTAAQGSDTLTNLEIYTDVAQTTPGAPPPAEVDVIGTLAAHEHELQALREMF